MLKIIGIPLILTSAIILGIQLKQQFAVELKQLLGMKEVILMIEGEMSYVKTPLKEAFLHIAQREEPFGSFLEEVSLRMEKEPESSLQFLWKDTINKQKRQFLLTKEELGLWEQLGDNFGYLDVSMQLNHLELVVQQTEHHISEVREQLAQKQKVSQYLCVMGGCFVVLLLL